LADVAAFVCGSFASSRTPTPFNAVLSAAPSLTTAHMAGLAGRRQPTPYFPQPKAAITRLPAVHRHKRAPNKPVPAANNGGYSANQFFITRVP